MTQRANAWSVTINNPIAADEENIALARQKGWKVEGQLEKGESGTPHYQLMVKTPQVRFSAVKKQFPRAHIGPARNVGALNNYVHKEETRVAPLKTDQDKYPSLSKLWQMYANYIEENRLFFPMLSWSGDEHLEQFDLFINELILKGFHVETMAVNPSTRSSVKKFGYPIITRAINENNGSYTQTEDRQTDEESIQEVDITNASDNESIIRPSSSLGSETESCVSEEEVFT